jgi:NAD(P)-dependent dehydrogenase (short-subunit alcohol dehydrogenase family)
MAATTSSHSSGSAPRIVVVSGGTDGMGRALTLARIERGDQVIAIGSNGAKGSALLEEAGARGGDDRLRFLRADLSTIGGTRAVVDEIAATHGVVDALTLFANRQAPKRIVTVDNLEATFALYYLSRYLLGYGLRPLLEKSTSPVIVNVAGVGVTKGAVHWDDMQLARSYGLIAAQLQAGRANDLLGVAEAARSGARIPYVLYHPGFTRSGDLTPLPVAFRAFIRAAAKFSARPVAESIAPINGFIDRPPAAPLTAVDRGKSVPLTLETLDAANASRLARVTEELLADLDDRLGDRS